MFKNDDWISFGLKPRAKDLKTVVEDLQSMEYLNNMSEIETNVVLDGNKVRIGFSGDDLDPFYNDYEEQGEFLEKIALELENRKQEAILEMSLTINQKLDSIL